MIDFWQLMYDREQPPEVSERLREIREARGYKRARWAPYAMQLAGLDVPEPTYAKHDSGRLPLTAESLKTYSDFYGVDPMWILAKEGADPFADGMLDPHPEEAIRAAKLEASKATKQRRIREKTAPFTTRRTASVKHEQPASMSVGSETGRIGIPNDGFAMLNARGGMGGGGVSIIEEGVRGSNGLTFSADSIVDYWRLPTAIAHALAPRRSDILVLPVAGTSMLPLLAHGDFVFVDTRHRSPSSGGIFALVDDFEEIIVKILRVVDDDDDEPWIEIISANPDEQTRRRRADQVRIIGQVVKKFSSVGYDVPEAASVRTGSDVFDRERLRRAIAAADSTLGRDVPDDSRIEFILSAYDGRPTPAPSQKIFASDLVKYPALFSHVQTQTSVICNQYTHTLDAGGIMDLANHIYLSLTGDNIVSVEGNEAEIDGRIKNELQKVSA